MDNSEIVYESKELKYICRAIDNVNNASMVFDMDAATILKTALDKNIRKVHELEQKLAAVKKDLIEYKQNIIDETHRDDLEFLDEVIAKLN